MKQRKPRKGDKWIVVNPKGFYASETMEYGFIFDVMKDIHEFPHNGPLIRYPDGSEWWASCDVRDYAALICGTDGLNELVGDNLYVGDKVRVISAPFSNTTATVISRVDVLHLRSRTMVEWDDFIPILSSTEGSTTWDSNIGGYYERSLHLIQRFGEPREKKDTQLTMFGV